jgi:hypothetical protein
MGGSSSAPTVALDPMRKCIQILLFTLKLERGCLQGFKNWFGWKHRFYENRKYRLNFVSWYAEPRKICRAVVFILLYLFWEGAGTSLSLHVTFDPGMAQITSTRTWTDKKVKIQLIIVLWQTASINRCANATLQIGAHPCSSDPQHKPARSSSYSFVATSVLNFARPFWSRFHMSQFQSQFKTGSSEVLYIYYTA